MLSELANHAPDRGSHRAIRALEHKGRKSIRQEERRYLQNGDWEKPIEGDRKKVKVRMRWNRFASGPLEGHVTGQQFAKGKVLGKLVGIPFDAACRKATSAFRNAIDYNPLRDIDDSLKGLHPDLTVDDNGILRNLNTDNDSPNNGGTEEPGFDLTSWLAGRLVGRDSRGVLRWGYPRDYLVTPEGKPLNNRALISHYDHGVRIRTKWHEIREPLSEKDVAIFSTLSRSSLWDAKLWGDLYSESAPPPTTSIVTDNTETEFPPKRRSPKKRIRSATASALPLATNPRPSKGWMPKQKGRAVTQSFLERGLQFISGLITAVKRSFSRFKSFVRRAIRIR